MRLNSFFDGIVLLWVASLTGSSYSGEEVPHQVRRVLIHWIVFSFPFGSERPGAHWSSEQWDTMKHPISFIEGGGEGMSVIPHPKEFSLHLRWRTASMLTLCEHWVQSWATSIISMASLQICSLVIFAGVRNKLHKCSGLLLFWRILTSSQDEKKNSMMPTWWCKRNIVEQQKSY